MKYEVSIQRLELNAVIDLQGSAQALADWVDGALPPFPANVNTYSKREGMMLCWIAPERWLLRAPGADEARLLAMTRPAIAPLEISIVQVSDTLRFFAISGPDASAVISMACPLDHHASVFPANGVSYTSLFGIKGLLIRVADGFEIAVESSFADMIDDYLARATAS